MIYMRNVQTGEVREVRADSDELRELGEQRYEHDLGRLYPLWEQTGDHHVNRIDNGEVNVPADLGYEDTPVVDATMRSSDLGPDPHPERSLTAAERKAGISSYEEKMQDLGYEVPGAEQIERGLQRVGRQSTPPSTFGTSTPTTGTVPDSGGEGDSGNGETVAQLRERAKDQGVQGYSGMNKAELQAALGG